LEEVRGLCDASKGDEELLSDLAKWPAQIESMGASSDEMPSSPRLSKWFDAIKGRDIDLESQRQKLIRDASGFAETQTIWHPVELFDLSTATWDARRDVHVGAVLEKMAERCEQTLAGGPLPGLARLRPGFDQPDKTIPFDRNKYNATAAEPKPVVRENPVESPPEQEAEEPDGRGRRRRRRAEPEPTEETPETAQEERGRRRDVEALPWLLTYHNRDFLIDTLRTYARIKLSLAKVQVPEAETLASELDRSAKAYVTAYFSDWYDVYSDYRKLLDAQTLGLLEKCKDPSYAWPQFVADMEAFGDQIGAAEQSRMRALIGNAIFFDTSVNPDEATDKIIEDVTFGSLDALKTRNRSLPDVYTRLYKDYRYYFESDRGRGTAEVAIASKLEGAWGAYVDAVKALGPLTGDAPPRSATPPDVDALVEGMLDAKYLTPDFPLTAPLVDVARYSRRLLASHLESRVASLISSAGGGYPVTTIDALEDKSASLSRLGSMSTIAPQQFVNFLARVYSFDREYGSLYRTVVADPRGKESIEACKRWVTFLFGNEAPMAGSPTRSVGVRFRFDRANTPPGTVNMGSVYFTVTCSLPVLKANSVAPDVTVSTRGGEEGGDGGQWPYAWNLTSNAAFRPVVAVAGTLSDDGRRAGWAPQQEAWRLPASPWSLALLIGAHSRTVNDQALRIPVMISSRNAGEAPRGIYILVEFERPFPGPIPPLSAPAGPGGLTTADKYFARKP
jgi:hypothetical protein